MQFVLPQCQFICYLINCVFACIKVVYFIMHTKFMRLLHICGRHYDQINLFFSLTVMCQFMTLYNTYLCPF